ncbi:MAG TPA: metallophosphoesterase [Candidatus Bathyarchaeia archaeon]|nr:metallophosphoesterase [Candidatus Bathyarchaeia archaeon]
MFRIFFASDIHASDIAFRKFLNAGNYYRADALLYGGDITGKALIFIEKDRDGNYQADFLGTHEVVKGEEQLKILTQKIMDRGYYYRIMGGAEIDATMQSKDEMHRLITEEMIKRVENWLELSRSLLANSQKKMYLLLGNDDPRDVLDAIRSGTNENIIDVNEKNFTLGCGIEGIGVPFSNVTPWKLPGDVPEDELQSKIEKLASGVQDIPHSIFLIHVPPVDTAIDEAPLLEDLKIKVDVTGIKTTHVGSIAVRSAIEKFQPMLSLHGHIHESRGVARIGKTLCINPGSEYEQGVLRGAVINIDEKSKKLRSHLLVSG